MNNTLSDPLLQYRYYILHIVADSMEEAAAQLIRFYEGRGWGYAEKVRFSGIPLIYEAADLPPDRRPLDVEVRSLPLAKALDSLCKRTRGLFRENFYENRVFVIRKQKNSLLLGLKIQPFLRRRITVADALRVILQAANRSDPKIRLRFEHPETIRIREGEGPSHLALFQDLPRSVLDRRIDLLIKGKSLIDGLIAVLIAQPYPFYITLKPDTQGTGFTHVLRFDSLPESYPKGARAAGNYIRYRYIPVQRF